MSNDPIEESLVEQAARDCLATLSDNLAIAGGSAGCIRSVSKFIRSGDRLIRVSVGLVKEPATATDEGGE